MSVNMDVQEMPAADKSSAPQQPPQQKIKDIKIASENDALNVMVGFLQLAQRRGVFTLEEAAKIHECVEMFQRQPAAPAAPSVPPTSSTENV